MMTKAEAKQICDLLTHLVREARGDAIVLPSSPSSRRSVTEWRGMDVVAAVGRAQETLALNAEGQILPIQLERARKADLLPACSHARSLMDWSGEQLVPPCGCRLVEPTDG